MQQLVNLSINTLQVMKYIRSLSAYKMQWLMSCILILNFQNGGSAISMKTVIMDHIMDTRFELQYKAVAEFKLSFVFLLEETSDFVNCVMTAGFTGPLRQRGQEN